MEKFQSTWLSAYPTKTQKVVKERDGDGRWIAQATIQNGDVSLLQNGKYEVVTDTYSYILVVYASLDSPLCTFRKGDVLLTRDYKE